MKSKFGQLNSGIDPEMLIDGMTIAGAYIESGVRKFSDYAKAMVDDFGDGVKPYLLSFWEGAHHYPKMTGVEDSAKQHEALQSEAANEPAKLDQPSKGALEGVPADTVQPAQGERPAQSGAQGRSGKDASGNERTGSVRSDDARSVGNGEGAVPVSAGGSRDGGRRADAVRGADAGSNGDKTVTARGRVTPAAGTPAPERPASFFTIDPETIGNGGKKSKYKDNVAAILLLKDLERMGRQATAEEQVVLSKYVGWGGIPEAFERDDGSAASGWAKDVAQLKDILQPEEYSHAAASTRNAHYTAPEVVGLPHACGGVCLPQARRRPVV